MPDLGSSADRSKYTDPLSALVASKRSRISAYRETVHALEAELRVIDCFSKIRADWHTLPCRDKLRHVLRHGASFAPSELAALLGEKINTIRSSLIRMRKRGEVRRENYGKWTAVHQRITAEGGRS